MAKQKGVFTENSGEKYVFVIPALILLIGAIAFFSGGGGAALAQQSTGFWVWVVIGVLIAAVAALFAKYLNDHGDDRKALLVVIIGLVVLCSPFGKACTDKADPITKKEASK